MMRFSVACVAAWAIALGGAGRSPAQQTVREKPRAPAAGQAQDAQAADSPSAFLRLVKDPRGNPVAMETAIVRYAPIDCGQTGPTVDLFAAVHIGEKSYYKQLNEEFKKYDVVLYELVAPEGTRVPKGGGRGSSHPVSAIQQGMTQLLDLSFQLNEVDYQAKNFAHADMSPEQLSKAMANRGESLWTMLVRSMGYALAKQNRASGGSSDAELLMALFDRNRALALKRVMAEQFQDMEGMMKAMAGPDGSALIAGRNQAALKVLKEKIAAGKGKIAIFYGAGHMSDMEKRLRDDFAMAPVGTRWLVAWNLKGEAPKAESGKPKAKSRKPKAESGRTKAEKKEAVPD